MKLRFWGVRGSAATPGPMTLGYGGNTACVELQAEGADVVVFDGGTGIRELGLDLLARSGGSPLRVHLFLTHFHWDHIQGIPFFIPLFSPKNQVTIYSSEFSAPLREALRGLMAVPYFPVQFETLAAQIELVELKGAARTVGSLTVRPFETNHPQGACAYRVDADGSSAVYSPDREHGDARLDQEMLEGCRGAGVVVVDSQYTPEEYETHRGWGHSTWAESAKLARAAGVKRLVLFHHDPGHTDDFLDRIQEDARREFPETWVAREGWTLEV